MSLRMTKKPSGDCLPHWHLQSPTSTSQPLRRDPSSLASMHTTDAIDNVDQAAEAPVHDLGVYNTIYSRTTVESQLGVKLNEQVRNLGFLA